MALRGIIGRRDVLRGVPAWWGRDDHPVQLEFEVEPDPPWEGWRRQRMEPRLAGFVMPAAWSAFLLLAGWIPRIISDLSPQMLNLTSGMVLASFGILFAIPVRDAMSSEHGQPWRTFVWAMLGRVQSLDAAAVWTLIAAVSIARLELVSRGIWTYGPAEFSAKYAHWGLTLGLIMTACCWWLILKRNAQALGWPPGRWLSPIAHNDIGLETLPPPWKVESRRWARRPLARHVYPSGWEIELFGERMSGADLLCIHVRHPSGRIIDPFTAPEQVLPFKRSQQIRDHAMMAQEVRGLVGPQILTAGIDPLLTPVVGAWPEAVIAQAEEDIAELAKRATEDARGGLLIPAEDAPAPDVSAADTQPKASDESDVGRRD